MILESPYLLPQEALAYLRMSAKWSLKIYNRWCRAGKIRARKVGKIWLTKKEWLDTASF